LIAGIDVWFEDRGRVTRAAVAVLKFADLPVVESPLARRPTAIPYVPGLLSFRELPAALDALAALACTPDLLLADGQGLAHPRRFGLACHLGWLLDAPTSASPSPGCWVSSRRPRTGAAPDRRCSTEGIWSAPPYARGAESSRCSSPRGTEPRRPPVGIELLSVAVRLSAGLRCR
jgi:Endonuclease V